MPEEKNEYTEEEKKEIEHRIFAHVAEEAGFDIEEITRDQRFKDHLNIDSLERLNMVLTIQNEFCGNFSDELFEDIETVGDLCDALTTKDNLYPNAVQIIRQKLVPHS